MGVKTQVVSLGDYRRKALGGAHKVPPDYFTPGERGSCDSSFLSSPLCYSVNTPAEWERREKGIGEVQRSGVSEQVC